MNLYYVSILLHDVHAIYCSYTSVTHLSPIHATRVGILIPLTPRTWNFMAIGGPHPRGG